MSGNYTLLLQLFLHLRARPQTLEMSPLNSGSPNRVQGFIVSRGIGKVVPVKKKFKIVDYTPDWNDRYQAECSIMRKVFGDLVNSIHHIGSTAILTAKSKPEIDILVVVKDVSSLSRYDEAIERLGYKVRGECLDSGGTPGRYYYSKDVDNVRTHKMHVCAMGHIEIMDKLLFVKYLNEDASAAKEYSALKLKLSLLYNYGNQIEKYLSGKSEFIAEILDLAREKYKHVRYEDFIDQQGPDELKIDSV